MLRLLMLCAATALAAASAHAQFSTYQAFRDSLDAVVAIQDSGERSERLGVFLDSLAAQDQLPFKLGSQAAFLYRGSGNQVRVAGDFNRWNPAAGPATRLGSSDVWIREETFPADARLDYKFVIGSSQWILDPRNPHRQRGGFGDNSELRMPDYEPSPWVTSWAWVNGGSYTSGRSLSSTHLGYSVTYRVYTPAGYDASGTALPTIYVTDGHEYADNAVGSMRIVLDNLIHEGLIQPVIAVFVDPRVGGQNRRGEQYVENPDFAAFLAEELVPEIDGSYNTLTGAGSRGILGTSLGGLNSAYVGATHPDVFGLIGIQSPAFHAGSTIYSLYRDQPTRDLRIHMTWGTIFDVGTAGEQMETILRDKGYPFETVVLNEGHSWGSWRALLDDVLIYFFEAGSTDVAHRDEIPERRGLTVFPNPASGASTIVFALPGTEAAVVEVFDMIGRLVAVPVRGVLPAGQHRVDWRPPAAPGIYAIRLQVAGSSHIVLQTVR
ncbi:MAG: T9SS type A sorting domain-containing protein [Rhodothermales bacterium]|nr:T9SS type A sorting domain-containing protein [Rhodothermales bacterium]MBO6778078.1 T9SS type A sorting domain-containing protein [Rhodothermales bacterium]